MQHSVLIVEDSRAYRNYLTALLSKLEVDLLIADDYQSARRLLDAPESTNILCAVLDYCLPDAQDGEIVDLLIEKNIPSIVLTAHVNDDIRQRLVNKGILDYILKDSVASVAYLAPLIDRLINNLTHTALVVDDSVMVRRHMCQLLQRCYIHCLEAENGQQGLEILKQHPRITLVIVDHDMPIKNGVTMIQETLALYPRHKFMLLGVSASNDRSITSQFLKAGANDFLHKPFNQDEFYCRVNNLLNLKDSNDRMFYLANKDALTGLWNRRFFFDHIYTTKNLISIAMLDLDHFKKVNDLYGHAMGDQVLQSVAQCMKNLFNHEDNELVARFGGEEFCLYSKQEFPIVIEKLEQLIKQVASLSFSHNQHSFSVTISVGLFCGYQDISTLVNRADDMLYEAKRRGRNQLIYKPNHLAT